MGMPGYIIFNIANVVTLIGMASGTMVRTPSFLFIVDCDDRFLIFSSSTYREPYIEAWYFPGDSNHSLSSLLSLKRSLVCLSSLTFIPRLLVGISSFGLVALIVSLIILFFYGIIEYGFKFDSSFWFPRPNSILNNLGVFINSLAFSLMCLSQVVNHSLHLLTHRSILRNSIINPSPRPFLCLYSLWQLFTFSLVSFSFHYTRLIMVCLVTSLLRFHQIPSGI